MGRAFEYRKATKMKRWGHMARTFTKLGKQIAIAVKAGGPEAENNPTLRAIIATCKRENMPKDNIERAIKNAMGKDQSEYKEVPYEGYGPRYSGLTQLLVRPQGCIYIQDERRDEHGRPDTRVDRLWCRR